MSKEIEYFQKKYSFKIEFLADAKMVIPEYKIDLFNKSKKIINSVEDLDKINLVKEITRDKKKLYKQSENLKLVEKKLKKSKTVKKKRSQLRTLWVRKKKKN